jgi:acetoin utilization protein AcuB
MIIETIMTKNPICISEDTTIPDAKSLMIKNNISKLPVLNSSKKLIGIITKNDVQKVTPSEATSLDMYEISTLLSKLKCGKYMTKKVITVTENEVLEEAARIMVDNNIGCLPVVKDDIVVGIVTESDLFHLFIDMFGARYKGVRANICQNDKPGELAKLLTKIAENNGNIVSVVTRESDEKNTRRVTIKVTDITKEKMNSIIIESGAKLIDLRII